MQVYHSTSQTVRHNRKLARDLAIFQKLLSHFYAHNF